MLSRWLHNLSGTTKNYGHGDILDGEFWQIPSIAVRDRLSELPSLFNDVASGVIKISLDGENDESGDGPNHWSFLTSGHVSIRQQDKDTGGLATSPKWAPDGWHQQYFETEFETCNSGSDSIHEKSYLNVDLGYSSLKFFKLVEGVEVECTDQTDIDANCTRTDLLWMPPFDFFVKSGYVSQKVVPAQNIYVWVLAVDLPDMFGGPQAIFANGGINMTFVNERTKSGLDGVAASLLSYSHPQLGPGMGTNRFRFVTRHPIGFKHRIQVVLELFVE
jgi:hypothetical protein